MACGAPELFRGVWLRRIGLSAGMLGVGCLPSAELSDSQGASV